MLVMLFLLSLCTTLGAQSVVVHLAPKDHTPPAHAPWAVAHSPQGLAYWTVGADNHLRQYNLLQAKPRALFQTQSDAHTQSIKALCVRSDGVAYSTEGSNSIKVWTPDLQLLAEIPQMGCQIQGLTAGHHDLLAAWVSISDAGAVCNIWQVVARREIIAFPVPVEQVQNLRFSPDDRYICLSNGQYLYAYNAETGDLQWQIQQPNLHTWALSADGQWLALQAQTTLYLYPWGNTQAAQTWELSTPLDDLQCSTDGQTIYGAKTNQFWQWSRAKPSANQSWQWQAPTSPTANAWRTSRLSPDGQHAYLVRENGEIDVLRLPWSE